MTNETWKCKTCGCLWRRWGEDGTWSLLDNDQRPCDRCDNGDESLLDICEPVATAPDGTR